MLPESSAALARITQALVAVAFLAGCVPIAQPVTAASDDDACQRTIAALVASKRFAAEELVDCEGGASDERPGYYVLRVNGVCRDPQGCGSVLMGWYAVEAATGAVYDWDVNEWQLGQRIDGQS